MKKTPIITFFLTMFFLLAGNLYAIEIDEKDFLESLKMGDSERSKMLVTIAPSFARIKDQNGWNALHYSAYNNDYELSKLLISKGAYPKAVNNEGCTPLHYAAQKGNKDIVDLLAISDIINLKNNKGYTGIHYAALRNEHEIVEALLRRGANPNVQDLKGNTPLHYAATKKNINMISALLSKAAKPGTKNLEGKSPFHYAVINRDSTMIELFIAKSLGLEYTSQFGETYLHYVAFKGNKVMVKALLGAGYNPNAKSRYGVTPLHCAAAGGNMEVVSLLLANGADINAKTNQEIVNVFLNGNYRAKKKSIQNDEFYFSVARVQNDRRKTDWDKLHAMPYVESVKRRDSTYKLYFIWDRTPMHYAAIKGHTGVIEIFLKKGGLMSKDTVGKTPLDYLPKEKKEAILKLIQPK